MGFTLYGTSKLCVCSQSSPKRIPGAPLSTSIKPVGHMEPSACMRSRDYSELLYVLRNIGHAHDVQVEHGKTILVIKH